MANVQTARCPDCGVEMRALGVSVGSVGRFDIDWEDPALERWVSFECPKCLMQFQVNNKTGAVHKLR